MLLADGATGSNLFDMGLQTGDSPELWNDIHPDRIARQYQNFIDAGSDIILTNTFGGTRYRLKLHNAADRVAELNIKAAQIAREQVGKAGRRIIIGGSMGPTGEIMQPLGPLSHEDAVDAFEEQAIALKEGGVDVFWIETMSSREEVQAAVEGAARVGLPIVATFSVDTNGRTMMGLAPGEFARTAAALPQPPAAIGANCGTGASELVATVLGISQGDPDAIVVAKANAGIPEFVDGEIHYSGTPELMADYVRLARNAGARIIGGCCGTTPAHLAAMRASLEAHERGARPAIAEIEERLGPVSPMARGDDAAARPESARRRRRRR